MTDDSFGKIALPVFRQVHQQITSRENPSRRCVVIFPNGLHKPRLGCSDLRFRHEFEIKPGCLRTQCAICNDTILHIRRDESCFYFRRDAIELNGVGVTPEESGKGSRQPLAAEPENLSMNHLR